MRLLALQPYSALQRLSLSQQQLWHRCNSFLFHRCSYRTWFTGACCFLTWSVDQVSCTWYLAEWKVTICLWLQPESASWDHSSVLHIFTSSVDILWMERQRLSSLTPRDTQIYSRISVIGIFAGTLYGALFPQSILKLRHDFVLVGDNDVQAWRLQERFERRWLRRSRRGHRCSRSSMSLERSCPR